MSSWLRKQIKQKLEDVTEIILAGNALDYTAYASAVARYRVLKELLNDAEEHDTQIASGQIKDDDDD